MYTCSLNITIFSADPILSEVLPQLPPQLRFTREFTVCPSFNEEALRGADVLILNAPTDLSLRKVRRLCKSTAIFILCTGPERVGTLTGRDFEVLDDVWLMPCSAEYISFKFLSLMEKVKLRKDLYQYQAYLDTLMDASPNMVWFKDLRGAHILINEAFAAAVGKTKNDIAGRGHYYVWDIPPEEYENGEYVCMETEEIVIKEQRPCVFDEMVRTRSAMRQLKTYKSPIFDENGSIVGTVGIAHDVTDLENMDNELEIILRSMPFAIAIKNSAGEVVKVNEKFEEYFHLRAESIVGTSFDAWKSLALQKERSLAAADGSAEATYVYNGESRIMEMLQKPIYDVFKELVGHIFICRDVTTERSYEQRILQHATTDDLTGLANRRHFYSRLDKCRQNKQLSLLYLDLDNFKLANDTYGHHVGDMVLMTVAGIIKELFPLDITARVGGDEFLIALVGPCSEEFLSDKARLLQEKIHASFHNAESLRFITASIGIALTNDPLLPVDDLIKMSDAALYASKNNGKAQFSLYKESHGLSTLESTTSPAVGTSS